MLMGRVYKRLGQHERAVSCLNTAMEMDSKNSSQIQELLDALHLPDGEGEEENDTSRRQEEEEGDEGDGNNNEDDNQLLSDTERSVDGTNEGVEGTADDDDEDDADSSRQLVDTSLGDLNDSIEYTDGDEGGFY